MNYPKTRKLSGPPSAEHRAKISAANKGKKRTVENKNAISKTLKLKGIIPPSRKGSHLTLVQRRKISDAQKGNKHYNWRGGITGCQRTIRRSMEYRLWREAVFERDDYTCQRCSARGCYIEANHVLPFAFFADIRFEVLNGETLCKNCHNKTKISYRKMKEMYA